MKWYGLAVVLAVGFLVVGCKADRPAGIQVELPKASTPAGTMQLVDTAVADFEAALQGANTDAMSKAANKLELTVMGLSDQLAQKEQDEIEAAQKVGKAAPPATVQGKLAPATSGAEAAAAALRATPPDAAKAKGLLPQIKSSIDSVRDVAK